MTRIQADDRLVQTLLTMLRGNKKGGALANHHYRKAMLELGYNDVQIRQARQDCFDIAELQRLEERDAERAAKMAA